MFANLLLATMSRGLERLMLALPVRAFAINATIARKIARST